MHASKSSPSALATTGSALIYAIIGAAVFMTFLDQWVVNVALPAISRDLTNSSLSGLSWIVNGYTIALAALFIVAGRLGDRSGYRRLFLLGVLLFTLASLGCALAPNLPILVAVRVVQAAGAALLLPASLSLLLQSVPESQRHQAARLWSATGAIAGASGPALGGLLIDVNWRWVFIINVPIGIAILMGGMRLLQETREHEHAPLPDILGSLLLILGVAAFVAAIVQGPSWGWTSQGVVGLLAIASIALLWLWQRCATQPVPLIELNLLRVPAFAIANAGILLFSTSFAIMLLSNTLWCQDVWGYTALQTGLAMAPGPAIVPFVTIASRRAIQRYGAGLVISAGCLFFAAAQLWRVFTADASGSYVTDLLPSMLLGGTGVGLALSTLIASGTTALPINRSATGSAILNTGRQIASAIGVALLVAILGPAALGPDSVGQFHLSWGIVALLVVIAAMVTFSLRRTETANRSSGPISPLMQPGTSRGEPVAAAWRHELAQGEQA